jgi:hypothetical protein
MPALRSSFLSPYVVAVFASNRAQIDSAVNQARRIESNDVLGVIANDCSTRRRRGLDIPCADPEPEED